MLFNEVPPQECMKAWLRESESLSPSVRRGDLTQPSSTLLLAISVNVPLQFDPNNDQDMTTLLDDGDTADVRLIKRPLFLFLTPFHPA